jgi:hypothetical protein
MLSKTNTIWLVAYVVWICLLLAALFQARDYTLEHLADETSRGQWQQFKRDTRAKTGLDGPVEGPVQRKVPRPDEPPQLLLLRDYFGTCVSGTVLFGSALFAMIMIALRGAFSRQKIGRTGPDEA